MGECYGGVRGVQGQAWMRGGLGVIGYVISMPMVFMGLQASGWSDIQYFIQARGNERISVVHEACRLYLHTTAGVWLVGEVSPSFPASV
jgi:hypothetical protein